MDHQGFKLVMLFATDSVSCPDLPLPWPWMESQNPKINISDLQLEHQLEALL
jgi:hypothetical protein